MSKKLGFDLTVHPWVIRGRKAAELAVKECMVCRLQSSRVNQQLMGDIPSEVTEVSVPFSHISLDLFGPIIVRGIGNRRVSVKVWGALYACLSTKAIAVWAVTGYDAAHFLDAHTRHTSVYGVPQLVLSDHGSQLVAAAKELREWQTVNDMLSRSGTTWRFTETGCSWRNGIAERCIRLVKTTLMHIAPELGNLDVLELQTVFLRASMIANRRPIGARSLTEEDFYALTPSDLLLGRSTTSMLKNVDQKFWEVEQEVSEQAPRVLGRLETIVKLWWDEWSRRAFPLMLPRTKWAVRHRDVKVGDVVHLRSTKVLCQRIDKGWLESLRFILTAMVWSEL